MSRFLHGVRIGVMVVAVAGSTGACAGEADTMPVPPAGRRALQALADSAWAALTRGDTAAMERLRLTEYEHNVRVWPELPAARAEINHAVDLAWSNIEMRNAAARARLLAAFGDDAPAIRGALCNGRVRFESFHVLTDCHIEIEDAAAGGTRRFQLFRDVALLDGEYRIFRYYFDGE